MNSKNDRMVSQIERVANDFLKQFFAEYYSLPEQSFSQHLSEEQIEKLQKIGIPKEGRPISQVVEQMTTDICPYGYDNRHPRFFGFIPGPSSLISWLGDIITTAYNRNAGSWTASPTMVCIEQELLAWLCTQAGYSKEQASGLFVSGGSMANMTALIAARDKVLSDDNWHLGVAYVSEQTHSSVEKGLRMIGISSKRIRKIPVNSMFQMDTQELKCQIQNDKENGLLPFVVIASAGTTNTGSIDPLREISEICREQKMWLHTDGAFGASVLLSKKYRGLLDGIWLSDSISWDAHKWLFQTYACGIVLIKDKKNAINSFHAHPEYLKDLETAEEHLNPWDMGVELTRPARGLKLWLTLQVMGSDEISNAIEHGFQLAEWAQEELKKNPEVEIISPAQMAIINFRYAPKGFTGEETDELNVEISRKIVDSGYAGVFTTELQGKKVLRLCCENPATSEQDIRNTIQRLNQYCQEVKLKE